jgi:ribosomal protein S18 acetylase RimI-like enzyme
LEELSHDDPKLKEYTEALDPYVGGYNARKVPYQVFVHDKKLVGIVVISEEPVRMIEPIGTPMSIVLVVDYSMPAEILQEFAEAALRIAKQRNAVYSFIDIPAEHEDLVNHFMSIGYSEIAHSLRMLLDLNDYEGGSSNLRFVKVEREDVGYFIEIIMKFMSGSSDNMIDIVFGNIKGLPEEFIDQWYNSTSLNYVYDGNELVGILDLSSQGLNIANIGVSPEHRGKGYGRKIMHYAFSTLKERGDEQARLRVHAENKKAIGLYESAGMKRGRSFKALIWRK